MARIRNIKPSFWTSGSNAKLSLASRLLFIGLWNEADDEGRLIASPKGLAGALFPHDEAVTAKKVERWLEELIAQDKVLRYEVDGTAYLWVVNFSKHQKVHNPAASMLPSPDNVLFPLLAVVPDSGGSREALPNHAGGSRDRVPRKSPRNGEGDGNGDGKQERERNPIFDALVEIFGDASTTTRRGMYGKVASELKAAGADENEVLRRGNLLLQRAYKDPTPVALSKHWDGLGASKGNGRGKYDFDE